MRVLVKDIEVGMVLKRDIDSHSGQTVIPKGTILTQSIIDKLENFDLTYIEIDTGNPDDDIEEDIDVDVD